MATSGPDPYALNEAQRRAVLQRAVPMTQQIFTTTVNPAVTNIINVPPRNVGLIKGFFVEVSGGVTNGAGTVANRTNFGSMNVLNNITFTDLNNVQRIATTGYHLGMLNSARMGFGFGGAYAPNLPVNYGNHWTPFNGASSLAAAATGTVKHTYWVPLAFSGDDLTGAIYAAVINATMNLQLVINKTPFVGATDPLNAIYSGNAAGTWTNNVTVTVYQVYYDQLPMAGGAPVIPMIDVNTVYDLKQTTQSGLTQGQDFPVPYASYRNFLSTFAIYDNGGSFNAGSDVNYWALQAANSTNLFRISPDIAALMARPTFMCDVPPGTYYFEHIRRPINTIAYGNQELIINPSLVNAGASLITCFEAFTSSNQIPISTSLPGG